MNPKRILSLVAMIGFLFCAGLPMGFAQDLLAGKGELFRLPDDDVQTRWADRENVNAEEGAGGKANFGRKGSPSRNNLKAGESFVLAQAEGSGTVRRIWITINDRTPEMLRGLKLEMFWDGASTPAVHAPIGDFFCAPLGELPTFENALFSSPEGRSFNCCIPMPFKKGMKIVATNESGKELQMFFYEVDFTTGDEHRADTAYFHAYYRRENPTRLREDFEILPRVAGKGRFLGCNVGVIVNTKQYQKHWWGEGEVKIYLDGDREYPTLVGTGTEDYIGTGWGMGAYANLYQGCTVADTQWMRYAFYRLHIPDPVYFHDEIRATIQQLGGTMRDDGIRAMEQTGFQEYVLPGDGKDTLTLDELREMKEGFVLMERTDDWCATSYFYLDRPENGLPPIEAAEKRIVGLEKSRSNAKNE